MQTISIALSQLNITWENPQVNKQSCETYVAEAASRNCDYIVFPEMTLTGFTMMPERFADSENDTIAFFRMLAINHHIGIVFGYISKSTSGFLNKMMILDSNGQTILDYAKLHPFSYGEEAKHYIGGDFLATATLPTNSGAISEVNISKQADHIDSIRTDSTCSDCMSSDCICSGFICYDLRFPEIFQKVSKTATVIFLIANWPEARIAHWYSLLQARAIENQCFIIGVNRSGDGNGLHYCNSSIAYDPYGNQLTPDNSTDSLLYIDINPALAEVYRQEFPLKADRRESIYYKN